MPISNVIKTLLTAGWNDAAIAIPTLHELPHFPTNRIERNLYIVDNNEVSVNGGSADNTMEVWQVPFSVVIFEKDQSDAEKSASQVKSILLRDKTANTLYVFSKYKLTKDLKICEVRMDGHQLILKGDDEV